MNRRQLCIPYPRPALPRASIRYTLARPEIARLMNNECVTALRLPAKEPSVAVWAAVEFAPF
jgi:hypothetical protein